MSGIAIAGPTMPGRWATKRSEEHTSELQSQSNLVCRLLLEKKTPCDRQLPTRRVVQADLSRPAVVASIGKRCAPDPPAGIPGFVVGARVGQPDVLVRRHDR